MFCISKINGLIISLEHDYLDVVHVHSRVAFPHHVSSYPIVALTILLFLTTHLVVMTHLTQIRCTACILKLISRMRCSHQAIVSMRRKPCLLGLDIVLQMTGKLAAIFKSIYSGKPNGCRLCECFWQNVIF